MMNHVENTYAWLWISRGLLFIAYKPGTVIDIRAARKVTTDRLALQKKETFPVFVDFREVKCADKEARDYFATDGLVLMRCMGVLIATGFARTLVDYYRKSNKPTIPVELFTEERDALNYLKNYI
ncbi:DUF7793 family protein [Sinomicrobium sp. M5D2P9]